MKKLTVLLVLFVSLFFVVGTTCAYAHGYRRGYHDRHGRYFFAPHRTIYYGYDGPYYGYRSPYESFGVEVRIGPPFLYSSARPIDLRIVNLLQNGHRIDIQYNDRILYADVVRGENGRLDMRNSTKDIVVVVKDNGGNPVGEAVRDGNRFASNRVNVWYVRDQDIVWY